MLVFYKNSSNLPKSFKNDSLNIAHHWRKTLWEIFSRFRRWLKPRNLYEKISEHKLKKIFANRNSSSLFREVPYRHNRIRVYQPSCSKAKTSRLFAWLRSQNRRGSKEVQSSISENERKIKGKDRHRYFELDDRRQQGEHFADKEKRDKTQEDGYELFPMWNLLISGSTGTTSQQTNLLSSTWYLNTLTIQILFFPQS